MIQGQTLSLLWSSFAFIEHSRQRFEEVSVDLFSAFMFPHFVWHSGLPLFQIAIESGTCWVGLDSGKSSKQVWLEFKSSGLSPQDHCCSSVLLQWTFSPGLHYSWVRFHLLR